MNRTKVNFNFPSGTVIDMDMSTVPREGETVILAGVEYTVEKLMHYADIDTVYIGLKKAHEPPPMAWRVPS